MRWHRTQAEIDDHRRHALAHAVERAKQRTGIELSEHDVMRHACIIWSGKTTRIGFGAIKRELHAITELERTFLAVWDRDLRRIVSYLSNVSEWKGSLTPAGQRLQMYELDRLPTTE